ncbi:response regulator, partial [bacterium]|nr:response regulator [bacterium]
MDTAVRSKRILILDDEPGILELLDSYLQSCGFETHPTSRWTQAVELITHRPPDLVLLDLQMPTVQGDTVLEFIQQQGRPIPVIIISAYLDERRIEALRRIGARGFVPKPFQLNALASTVREALGLSAGAAALPPLTATPDARAEVPSADFADSSSRDTPPIPPAPEVVEV